MKAVRLHEYGGPEVLKYEDAPTPAIAPGEVLVRVHAVGVNPPDWYLREGMKMLPPEWRPSIPMPVTLGTDISGVVENVASDVDFEVGDEVFGMVRFPSFGDSQAYAEYVAVPATNLALKPKGIDHIHAAGAPMALLTAWQFLVDLGHDQPNPFQPTPHTPIDIHPGLTVFVNGAAGGVGHFAVQIAKWKGARVIACASGEHEKFLKQLGAECIDYTACRPEDVIKDVDIVLDCVGGPNSGRFLKMIKRGGVLYPVFLATIDPKEAEELGVTVSSTQVRSNGKQLAEMGHLLEDGTIQVGIDSTFPLAETSRAHERAAKGHIRGKIVLTVV